VKRAEAVELLNLLRTATRGGGVDHDRLTLWLEELRRLDYETGEQAVRSLVVSSVYFPSLAELHEQCRIAREQAARTRRDEERRATERATDALPRPPLREIPAARELLRRFHQPLGLEQVKPGACDECGRPGPRYELGRFSVCTECAGRRLDAREKAELPLISETTNAATSGEEGAR
jgi:hypothetical protein